MPNPLAMDPSQTLSIRRAFMANMKRRFGRLSQQITHFVVDQDAFGLQPSRLIFHARDFQFLSDPNKIEGFKRWLQRMIDEGILEANGPQPWMSEYLENAYRKGIVRAYLESIRGAGGTLTERQRAQERFLIETFGSPESTKTLQLLYTRSFDMLDGISRRMSGQISQSLATSFVKGYGAEKTARELVKDVKKMGTERALLMARTEIIRASAEGQLDAFERLDVEEVGLLAEISTAGDNLVCPICKKAEKDGPYTIEQARNMLPLHPQCRCSWVLQTRKQAKNRRRKVTM